MDLGEKYDGQVNFVKIDVTNGAGPEAGRYGVRGTPAFVLIAKDGEVLANVPGWPGLNAFEQAFNELLSQG